MGHQTMKPRQQVSRPAIELIKRFEGYRRIAAPLADGRWTVGYGHTKFAKEGVELAEEDAEALLIYDLIETTGAVSDLVFTPLTQNQYDALVSFTFNVGIDNFKKSAVLRRVNGGDLLMAAFALETWRRSDFEGEVIVVDALVRRRAAEKALFLTPQAGFIPAPSPVLRPRIDFEGSPYAPSETPRRLIAPLDGDSTQPFEDVSISDEAEHTAPFPDTVTSAMDALTSRLRDLVPDPELQAVAVASQPEPAVQPFLTEAPAEPETPAAVDASLAKPVAVVGANPGANGIRHFHRTPIEGRKLAPLLGLSAAGVLFFGFAIFWRLNAGQSEAQAASAQVVSYIAGIIGVGCIFAAAYMVLDRMAGEDR